MQKIIPIVLTIVILTGTTPLVMAEEYDLSDHPIYQPWEYNPDRNFSNERFSNPKASNEYHLIALSPFIDNDYDPTHVYLEKRVSTFDYCDLPQFSNYPKCR